jgi:hypothetical protein
MAKTHSPNPPPQEPIEFCNTFRLKAVIVDLPADVAEGPNADANLNAPTQDVSNGFNEPWSACEGPNLQLLFS